MSSVATRPLPSPVDHVNRCARELAAAKHKLSERSLAERTGLLEDCLERTVRLAHRWVDAACQAKGIPQGNPARAEEIAAGPVATARHLRLLIQNYRSVERTGHIELPAAPIETLDGTLGVQVMPVRGLFDSVVFAGFKAHTFLSRGYDRRDLEQLGQQLQNPRPAKLVLVLGAGNVSSIPATDTISKVFQEGHCVLLKMNPVNEYLGEIFEELFGRLISAGFVRVVYGGADVGAAAIDNSEVDEVHITGSIHSHDAIVWGKPGPDRERRRQEHDPLLKKPITSELGNVSPWIVVPADYSDKQLRFQAESVASSITNNASFNCVATKMIVTSSRWPQRERFLNLVEEVLAKVPPRSAYYPGAADRFARFTGRSAGQAAGSLPWTLVRNASPQRESQLFCEESFVCVCGETALDAADDRDFLRRAVTFANDKLWGTLSAALTVHPAFRKASGGERFFQDCVGDLRYGAIGINHWPALVYAMMSPPWGGYSGGTLANAQSGIGSVHNTFMLEHIEKTVLEGPITLSPKPFWFPTHRRPEPIAWKVLELYARPSAWKLPGLALAALRT